MQISSLYKFYQVHFGYRRTANDRQRIAYGLAVRDCLQVLKEVYYSQSKNPVKEYEESQYARCLTKLFLRNASSLAEQISDDPLGSIDYLDFKIEVDPDLLVMGKRKSLVVPSPILWHAREAEIIFLSFGTSYDMTRQLSVFRTLSEEICTKTSSLPVCTRYTYWDLRDGARKSVERSRISLAPTSEVISTCNRILAGMAKLNDIEWGQFDAKNGPEAVKYKLKL